MQKTQTEMSLDEFVINYSKYYFSSYLRIKVLFIMKVLLNPQEINSYYITFLLDKFINKRGTVKLIP